MKMERRDNGARLSAIASNFSEGLAGVRIGNKYDYIDKTGKFVGNRTN